MRKTRLKMRGTSDSSVLKEQIQSILRDLVIKRDGGCVLRNYPETGECGGYRNDGELILQAEHLVTRSNTVSFGDSRNVVCLCKRHHIFWKPQHSQMYWSIIEKEIGKDRWKYIQKVQDENSMHKAYKIDLKLNLVVLRQELKELEN